MNTQNRNFLSTEQRLILAAIVVVGLTGAMAFVGGSTSWQYYLTVDECLAGKASLAGRRIRVSGTVAPASLTIAPGRKAATFDLNGTGRGQVVGVDCLGPPPDNLAEGMQVVVEGELASSGRVRGEQVLTRCASKYESRQAAKSELGNAR